MALGWTTSLACEFNMLAAIAIGFIIGWVMKTITSYIKFVKSEESD